MNLRSSASPKTRQRSTMQTPRTDAIIAELRAVRDEHAARFNYDVKAIFRDLQTRQAASGRRYVRYPAQHANLGPRNRAPA